MKKFALLGAVAALATAGGVFAAWTFSGEGVTNGTSNEQISVTISGDKQEVGGMGTATITSENLSFTLKQGDDSELNHHTVVAELHASASLSVAYVSNDDRVDETVTVSYSFETTTGTVTGTDVEWTIAAPTTDTMVLSEGVYAPTANNAAEITLTFANEINTTTEFDNFKDWAATFKPVLKVVVTAA